MRKSTAILTTLALGAVLAIGSVSDSMARGGGGGGHGGGFGGGGFGGGDHGFGGGFGGDDHGFGSGFRIGDHGFSDRGLGERGFGRGYRGYDGYGGGWWDGWGPDYYYPYYDGDYTANDDANVAFCEARYHSYDPATGTYVGYDGHRHYCVA